MARDDRQGARLRVARHGRAVRRAASPASPDKASHASPHGSGSASPGGGEVVLYRSPAGDASLDVELEHDSVCLKQRQVAQLPDISTDTGSLHLKTVHCEGELDAAATTEESSVVQVEGDRKVRRSVGHYELDAVGTFLDLAELFDTCIMPAR